MFEVCNNRRKSVVFYTHLMMAIIYSFIEEHTTPECFSNIYKILFNMAKTNATEGTFNTAFRCPCAQDDQDRFISILSQLSL